MNPLISGEMLPIIFFILITIIIKIMSDNRLRRKLIDKGMVNENIQYLFVHPVERQIPGSLKWGMVLIAIGLAVFVGQLVPVKYSDEITFALMFIFSGLALVIFYFIAAKAMAKNQKLEKTE